MSTKHTPGPWVTGNTDPLLFGAQRGPGTEPIGFVYGPSCPEDSEVGRRAMSNARLIAAAPDLLLACVWLHDLIRMQPSDIAEQMPLALGAAKTAIAKATGAQT